MPSKTPSEGSEPTSAAKKTMKDLFKKNKTKILIVGGTVIAGVTGMVICLGKGYDITEEARALGDSGRLPEPLSSRGTETSTSRQTPGSWAPEDALRRAHRKCVGL
ncbi:hypothetical protein [Streptomyces sp. BH105]|uniref:hypothetical protein n=1 Tax=Streptomyces sp. BH105 TaxID=3410408 RepID=UPI003CEEEC0F